MAAEAVELVVQRQAADRDQGCIVLPVVIENLEVSCGVLAQHPAPLRAGVHRRVGALGDQRVQALEAAAQRRADGGEDRGQGQFSRGVGARRPGSAARARRCQREPRRSAGRFPPIGPGGRERAPKWVGGRHVKRFRARSQRSSRGHTAPVARLDGGARREFPGGANAIPSAGSAPPVPRTSRGRAPGRAGG